MIKWVPPILFMYYYSVFKAPGVSRKKICLSNVHLLTPLQRREEEGPGEEKGRRKCPREGVHTEFVSCSGQCQFCFFPWLIWPNVREDITNREETKTMKTSIPANFGWGKCSHRICLLLRSVPALFLSLINLADSERGYNRQRGN